MGVAEKRTALKKRQLRHALALRVRERRETGNHREMFVEYDNRNSAGSLNHKIDYGECLRNERAPARLPALLRLGRPCPRETFRRRAAFCHRPDPPAAVVALYH